MNDSGVSERPSDENGDESGNGDGIAGDVPEVRTIGRAERADELVSVAKTVTVESDAGDVVVGFEGRPAVDVPVAFRLVDEVPDGVRADDVAFEPAENWTVDGDGTVTFRATATPEAPATGAYRVRLPSDLPPEAFTGAPSIDTSTAVSPEVAAAAVPVWRGSVGTVADGATSPADGPNPAVDEPSADGSNTTTAEPSDGDAEWMFDAVKERYGRTDYEEIRDDVSAQFEDDVSFESLVADTEDQPDDAPADAAAERGAANVTPTSDDRPGDGPIDGETSAVEADERDDGREDVREGDEREDATGTDECGGAETGPDSLADASGTDVAEPFDALAEEFDDFADEFGDPADGADPPNVLSALAAALQAADEEDDDVEILRDAVGRVDREPHHVDVQLDHLQSKVADLEAYVDALEAFIDGSGTAAEVLERLESDVSELSTGFEERDEEVAALRSRTDRVEDRLADVEDLLADVVERLETDDERDDRLAALERRVTVNESRWTNLETVFAASSGDVEDADERDG